jgi:hypothetical protein
MSAETGRIRCEAQGVHTAPDGSTYRFRRLVGEIAAGNWQWSVTRTEAVIVETRADATRAEVEAAIAARFEAEPPAAGHSWDGSERPEPGAVIDVPSWLDPKRYADPGICGACGAYVPGGADPSVMSAHDCEDEEQ